MYEIAEKYKDTRFNEIELKKLIRPHVSNVLIIGEPNGNQDYKFFLDVLNCYKNYIDSYVNFFFYSESYKDEILRKILRYYLLEEQITFVNVGDKEDELLYFLGSDVAMFLGNVKDEYVELVNYFKLPILSTDKEQCLKNDNYFYVSSEPSMVAAAIKVICQNVEFAKRFTR